MFPARHRRLLQEGRDPDPRFSLANERTFLAWIRTALALLASGIGVDIFLDDVTAAARRGLSGLLLLLGAAVALGGYSRWLAAERAMRTGRPLPLPGMLLLVALGVAVVAGVTLLVVLVAG